jgi:hypothetical protein
VAKGIPLTQGYVALVDDEDYEELSKYKWHVWKRYSNSRPYAVRHHTKQDGTHTTVKMHRQVTGAPPDAEVDHRNHDTLDNRRSNLRLVTHTQNQQNRRGASSHSKSGIRNVYYYPEQGLYRVQVRRDRIVYSFGTYQTVEEATKVAESARKELFGG